MRRKSSSLKAVLRTLLLPLEAPQNLFLFQSGLQHSLDQLCVVMEAVVQPDLGTEEEALREESPLLSSGVNPNKEPVTCNELLHLVPKGPPEVMRNIPPEWTEAPNHLPRHLGSKTPLSSCQPWGTPPFSPVEAPGSLEVHTHLLQP